MYFTLILYGYSFFIFNPGTPKSELHWIQGLHSDHTQSYTYDFCAICNRRIIFLETVAGVPGMVAAMTRHLQSLRKMRRDHGWIHTLLGMYITIFLLGTRILYLTTSDLCSYDDTSCYTFLKIQNLYNGNIWCVILQRRLRMRECIY